MTSNAFARLPLSISPFRISCRHGVWARSFTEYSRRFLRREHFKADKTSQWAAHHILTPKKREQIRGQVVDGSPQVRMDAAEDTFDLTPMEGPIWRSVRCKDVAKKRTRV